MAESTMGTRQKALAINLDPTSYGTFAEIGGGQEVARWFFSVGAAAGTVAKTISAYDMTVSDALYGPTQRYVSRQRLEAMLEYEFHKLLERLSVKRGDSTRFFVFANTVATASYRHPGKGRGWLGVRFQRTAREDPSDIIIHAHLLDSAVGRQQEALGTLGVNLLYGALFQCHDATGLITTLMDDLSRERVEIDMIKLSGQAFAGLDNRTTSLMLVERGLTDAAMFTGRGEVVQPSEILYNKPILVQRGSFRPATKLTVDLLNRALDQFTQHPHLAGQRPVVLAEMTLRSLEPGSDADHRDFLARAEILAALGVHVLISRFEPYYELAEYLAAYTDKPIGLAVGMPTIRQIADERYYTDLPGGVLESAGRLFRRLVTMYVYPTRDSVSADIVSVERAVIPTPWHHLRNLLLDMGRIEPIRGYDETLLAIQTPDVLRRIESGDPSWEEMVPRAVADIIKAKHLFGWGSAAQMSSPHAAVPA
jgi:hypothetical protein